MRTSEQTIPPLLVRRACGLLVVCLVGYLAGASGVAAQQPFGVPTSDRIVVAELTLPDSNQATVDVREGTLLTVKNQDLGYTIGLSPVIDESTGHVEFLVVDVLETETGSHVEFLSQIGLEVGTFGSVATYMGDLDIQVEDVKVGKFPRQPVVEPRRLGPRELEQQFGVTAGGVCCVTCGPWTICGSSVSLGCGSCDSGGNAI